MARTFPDGTVVPFAYTVRGTTPNDALACQSQGTIVV
jgi:hypothetical protein